MPSHSSTLLRLDNISIIVEDLDAVIEFFKELGLELEGRTTVEGDMVSRIIALDDVRCEVAMLRTPDGHSRLELSSFQHPKAIDDGGARAPVNTLGIRRIMFAVKGLEDMVERLRRHGAELHGEIVDYAGVYRLCYLRGPEGIMIALAEQLGSRDVQDLLDKPKR